MQKENPLKSLIWCTTHFSTKFPLTQLIKPPTLKSLINEQGGYVVFLVLSEYSFIRDFRVGSFFGVSILKRNGNKDLMIAKVFDVK